MPTKAEYWATYEWLLEQHYYPPRPEVEKHNRIARAALLDAIIALDKQEHAEFAREVAARVAHARLARE